jgi:hypothetical protein
MYSPCHRVEIFGLLLLLLLLLLVVDIPYLEVICLYGHFYIVYSDDNAG